LGSENKGRHAPKIITYVGAKSLICVPKARLPISLFLGFCTLNNNIWVERPNLRFENKGCQFRSLDFAPKYYVGVREGRPNLFSENKGHKFRSFDFAPKYYMYGKGLIHVMKTRVANFAIFIFHPKTLCQGVGPQNTEEVWKQAL
jgi:hypothetical protein